MENANNIRKPVRPLPPEVARKIAAGEVIDRPCAIVSELMDNAVDSGADFVQVEITGGGIDRIRIVDNGIGMTKEDLLACAKPHATSKIREAEDLLNLSTLGFRGEALSSIAAVSQLQITSFCQGESWRLEACVTKDHKVSPANLAKGTVVQSESLFNDFPARRMFLKRPSAETMLCRQTFIEKAIPRTDIAFKLLVDGKERLNLPKGQKIPERLVQALDLPESSSLFYELADSSSFAGGNQKPDWAFTLVIGEPAVYRTDRKLMFVYVNGRRINEYSLMQAIEYGGQGFFPNGTHPVAALFVEMNPALVDFNIHPAKKEARFKDLAPLHHAVSGATRNFFKSHSVSSLASQTPAVFVQKELYGTPLPSYKHETKQENAMRPYTPKESNLQTPSFKDDLRKKFFSDSYTQEPLAVANELAYPIEKKEAAWSLSQGGVRYIGNALGVFLLAEKDESIYIIDQHAAHERILYNKFMACAGLKQPLLVPYVLETSCEEDDIYLRSTREQLEGAGFQVKECGPGKWEFSSVPSQWKGTEKDLADDLLSRRIDPKDVLSSIAATNACRAAIKDGHVLDEQTARQLVVETLALDDPHCPHGRPLWTRTTKEDLFHAVRRT